MFGFQAEEEVTPTRRCFDPTAVDVQTATPWNSEAARKHRFVLIRSGVTSDFENNLLSERHSLDI